MKNSKRRAPQGLSLPKVAGSVPMPWQRQVIYTVETEDGEVLSMGPEELRNYAAGRRKNAETSR